MFRIHKIIGGLALLLALSLAGELGEPAFGQSSTHVIQGRPTYLLLDDRLIDRTENVRLRVGQPVKHAANPLFSQQLGWEVRFDNMYPNVLYDDDRKLYRCWYHTFIVDPSTSNTPREKRETTRYGVQGRRSGTCYAESVDGIHWTKPLLEIVPWEGRPSNIVTLDWHGPGVIRDIRDPDPSRRFKMFFKHQVMSVAFSPDGLQWSKAVRCPDMDARGDTHNNAWWAPSLQRYVGITRQWDGQRTVARTESKDFLHWSKPVEVLRGTREAQAYAMPAFYYKGVYLGLMAVYRTKEDRTHCELAWSPDTISWHRIDSGTPLIATGTKKGDYDWGCVYAGLAPVVRDNEIRIYYGGSDGGHFGFRDGSLCLATVKKDRFAGWEVETGKDQGVLITKPILCTGGKLLVNAASQEGARNKDGQMRVEILDAENWATLARSAPFAADSLDQSVSWEGGKDLSEWMGKPIRLKFVITGTRLFAFRFAPRP